MTATTDVDPAETSWAAEELHALADVLAGVDAADLPVALLDQLDALERIKSAAAAAQVVITAAFADTVEAADEAADDAPTNSRPDRRRRPPRAMSIGAEVALAVRTSPYQGEQRVLLARRLRDDLPGIHQALARGDLSEDKAHAVARQVAHLDPTQRARVDTDLTTTLGATSGGFAALGEEKLRQAVRRSCLRIAADAETRRHRKARADRHVTTRQLDDGTGRITATVAIEHLATVRTALDTAAATARAAGDPRTAGQVRADTLVHRLTGHDPVEPVPVRVNLVITAESLLTDENSRQEPGQVPGIGWLPAALCTDLVRTASAAAKATLRRLFVHPHDRALVAMESASRTFPTALAELINLRDGGLCRTPGCNARIRHHDHITRHADDGPTSAHNGQGLCERCNYVKETPGWTSWTTGTVPHEVHEVHGVTEHLRILRSTAPPLPRRPEDHYTPAELHVARALTLVA
jgi:hypothetical protein